MTQPNPNDADLALKLQQANFRSNSNPAPPVAPDEVLQRLQIALKAQEKTIASLAAQVSDLKREKEQTPKKKTPHLYKGPKFAGTLAPPIEEFLFQLENHFVLFDISTNAPRSQLLLDACTGAAASLLRQRLQNQPISEFTSYQVLRTALLEQFQDRARSERARNFLQQLRQTSTIVAFNAAFTRFLIDIDPRPSQVDLVRMYTNAVHWETASYLHDHAPDTIEQAMSLAAQREQKKAAHAMAHSNRVYTPTEQLSPFGLAPNSDKRPDTPMGLATTNRRLEFRTTGRPQQPSASTSESQKEQNYRDGSTPPYPQTPGTPFVRRAYTAAEKSLFDQGLCTRCAQPWTRGHRCGPPRFRANQVAEAPEPGRPQEEWSTGDTPVENCDVVNKQFDQYSFRPPPHLSAPNRIYIPPSKRKTVTFSKKLATEIPLMSQGASATLKPRPNFEHVPKQTSDQQDVKWSIDPTTIIPSADFPLPTISKPLLIQGEIQGHPIRILLDTGSDVDLVSRRLTQRLCLPSQFCKPRTLGGASGTIFDTITHFTNIPVTLPNFRTERHSYFIADIYHDIILGIPWCRSHRIQIDWDASLLCIGRDKIPFATSSRDITPIPLCSATQFIRHIEDEGTEGLFALVNQIQDQPTTASEKPQPKEISELISEYKDRFPEGSPGIKFANLPPGVAPDRGPFNHRIPLKSEAERPYSRQPRPLTQEEMLILKERIQELIELGHIRPSASPWGAPVLFARKKDGTLRLCIDYRALNKQSIRNVYPLPRIDELLDRLRNARFFTKIDLDGAYHQIRVEPADIPKTGFNCQFGHYEFLVMTFGLTNAPATFQHLMNHILQPQFNEFLVVYLDDILVFSPDLASHLQHLRFVLDKLREHQLYAKAKKCTWAQSSVEYLGHIVSEDGVSTDPSKTQAITEWPTPTNVASLQSFLGFANYYRRFVRNYSDIAAPLTNLTAESVEFIWTPACQHAFETLKQRLTTAPVLRIFDPTLPTRTEHDASDYAIGAVLHQKAEGRWHPIAFISRKLSPAERKASIPYKEFLSINFSLKKWRHYLHGRRFEILTDHRSLIHIPTQPNLTPRQVREVELLAEFDYDIVYREGSKNIPADALSRRADHYTQPLMVSAPRSEFLQLFIEEYPHDSALEHPYALVQTQPEAAREFQLVNGVLRHKGRICVPRKFQSLILREVHDLPLAGHPGISRTYKELKRNYWWAGMKETVTEYVRSCDICQRTKSNKQRPMGLLHPLPTPSRNFQHISMDFITSLPRTARGYDALMVIVCRLSKYITLIPTTSDADAPKTALLFHQNYYCTFGLPDTITSDRDGKFVSDFWQELFALLDSHLKMSSARHPETDGQTERMNQTVEQYLRAFISYNQKDWDQKLAECRAAYHAAVNTTTKMSPNLTVYGRHFNTPLSKMALDNLQVDNVRVQQFLQDVLKTQNECRTILKGLDLHDAPTDTSQPSAFEQNAAANIDDAKVVMARYANQSRRPEDLEEGDLALLSTKNLELPQYSSRTNRALSNKYIGPYFVTRKVGNEAFTLRLPGHLALFPTFHASQLLKYRDSPRFPDRNKFPAITDYVAKNKREPISAVLDRRYHRGSYEYLVRWDSTNSQHWVPAKFLENAHHLILEWEDLFSGLRGRSLTEGGDV